jgi:hypothetical protein
MLIRAIWGPSAVLLRLYFWLPDPACGGSGEQSKPTPPTRVGVLFYTLDELKLIGVESSSSLHGGCKPRNVTLRSEF